MFNQEDFFKVLDFLQNEERSTSDLPSEIQQLAKSVQGRTRNYFAAAVDIPAFNTDDYNRLRRMIIDWYSSLKTFQDISKGSSDAFSLPVELLDLSCRGFGFPYVKGIEGKIDKAMFLYSLCELYKIKGTPESIKRALEAFSIKDITMFEWWLTHNKVNNELYLQSKYIDMGGINPYYVPTYTNLYDDVNFDPHWWYTKQQIIQKLAENPYITLPSITPYFSLSIGVSVSTLTAIIATIGRIIADQYAAFILNGNKIPTDYTTIYLELYAKNSVSLLELMLAIDYLFYLLSGRNSQTSDPNDLIVQYSGLDDDGDGIIDSADGHIIIDEFGKELNYPRNDPSEYNTATRESMRQKLANFNTDFSRTFSDGFILDTTALVEVFALVAANNPRGGNLKTWIDENWSATDDQILGCLSNLLHELDVFSIMNYGYVSSSFEQMCLGNVNKNLINIINFFKPKRARLLNLTLLYEIDEPLINTIWLEDIVNYRITQMKSDYQSDNLKESLFQIITQHDRDTVFRNWDGEDWVRDYDTGNYYDIFPFQVYEELLILVRQYKDEQIRNTFDSSGAVISSGPIIDHIRIDDHVCPQDRVHNLPGYDMGYFYDDPPGDCVFDFIQKTTIYQSKNDWLKLPYDYDNLHMYDENTTTENFEYPTVFDSKEIHVYQRIDSTTRIELDPICWDSTNNIYLTYSISGTISGTTGVTLSLSGASIIGDTTCAIVVDDVYSFANILPGLYVVTPSKVDYVFSPASISVGIGELSINGVDFSGSEITYIISGGII